MNKINAMLNLHTFLMRTKTLLHQETTNKEREQKCELSNLFAMTTKVWKPSMKEAKAYLAMKKCCHCVLKNKKLAIQQQPDEPETAYHHACYKEKTAGLEADGCLRD